MVCSPWLIRRGDNVSTGRNGVGSIDMKNLEIHNETPLQTCNPSPYYCRRGLSSGRQRIVIKDRLGLDLPGRLCSTGQTLHYDGT